MKWELQAKLERVREEREQRVEREEQEEQEEREREQQRVERVKRDRLSVDPGCYGVDWGVELVFEAEVGSLMSAQVGKAPLPDQTAIPPSSR